MPRHAALLLVGFLCLRPAQPADASIGPEADGPARLLARVEDVLRSGDPRSYATLLSSVADARLAAAFADSVVLPGTTRAVVRERERADLEGTLPGDGHQLTVEALVERGPVARLFTWQLDVRRLGRRTAESDDGNWAIAGQRIVGSLTDIHRLALDGRKQYRGVNFSIAAEDVEFRFVDADVFVADAGGAPTAMVVLGRGEMRFAPTDEAERGQLKLFGGAEALTTTVESLFVRLAPGEFDRHLSGRLEEAPVAGRQLQKAAEIFRQDAASSFGLDLGDLSAETWSMLPVAGDFLAEVRTRKFGHLTYVRSSSEVEDVSLFDRARHRNIAVYASAGHRAVRGRFYADEDDASYKVVSYDIDTAFDPERSWVDGRTRLQIEVVAPAVSTLTIRLADSLAVRSVTSREYGRLLAVRVRDQNSLVVSLPAPVAHGLPITLEVAYAGEVRPQAIDQEAMGQFPTVVDERPEVRLEESFLYSNRSYWYPQAPSNSYSTATLRVRVPQNYSCVASGQLVATAAADAAGDRPAPQARRFTFVARRPARYFACLITPLVEAASKVFPTMTLEVKANPRLRGLARPLADTAGEILQYYSSIMGDTPYPDATVAAVEWRTPGGHSPAYLAVLNQPIPGTSTIPFRNDPAFFEGFPEFFIAHELAHQWWGQAVGWKNYHEQWLSEGLAQYFAALYAGRARGRATFESILRRFRQWSLEKSDQGPIYLGYRVGHIKGDSRVFRAVVYNKSAAVLHMLRGLTGDEAFFRGLRRFYSTWRFQKAGSDDLRRAMEIESGLTLDRFFERWIYGDRLPSIRYTTVVEDGPSGREAVVRFEQAGEVFDLPVTLTVDCADRPPSDTTVRITDRIVEARVPLAGSLRAVVVNRDNGALGTFTEARGVKR